MPRSPLSGAAPRDGVCVVGPGKRFLGELTYSTYALAESLSTRYPTSAVLLRELLPRRAFPAAHRIGSDLSFLRLSPWIERYDRLDWYWLPTMGGAAWFLRRQDPAAVILEYGSRATAHTLLAIAHLARRQGARVVVEVHSVGNVLDLGPRVRGGPLRRSFDAMGRRLLRDADRLIVHTEHDRDELRRALGRDRAGLSVPPDRVDVVPHLIDGHFHLDGRHREAPDGVTNLLCFGTIRPAKGVEDLVRAFDAIPPDRIPRYWLTIVGETWDRWSLPGELIARSRYRDRITFVNRWVADEDVDGYFAGADLVVLPHQQASTKEPLYLAMSYGKPAVVTNVGGLPEVAARHPAAVVVDAGAPDQLLAGVERALALAPIEPIIDAPADVCDRYGLVLEAVGVEPSVVDLTASEPDGRPVATPAGRGEHRHHTSST